LLRSKCRKEIKKTFVALQPPKNETINYKWAGKVLHSDLAVGNFVPMGLLESIPIEFALEPIEGENCLFINCIWILPPFWKKGVGKALMERFIKNAKKVGGASVLAYEGEKWFGTTIKYMPSNFFQKFAFKEVDRDESRVLLYLDLGSNNPPNLMKTQIPELDLKKNKLTLFVNNQCPWNCFMIDDIKTNIKKYQNIQLNLVNTDSKGVIKEYGISRGIMINGKPLIKRMASWSEIKKKVDKSLKNI